MKVSIIGGSREAAQLHAQLSSAVVYEGDDLPELFVADAVIDASHPCERETPERVAAMCDAQEIPYLRLRRAAWEPLAEDAWLTVSDADEAYATMQPDWDRVFLCLGEADRIAFAKDSARWYLIRTQHRINDGEHPARYALTEKNGPFVVEQEINLMRHHKIDVLVTRNAGGKGAVPKVSAARALGLPVVMLSRPEALGPEVTTIRKALSWLGKLSRR